MSSAVWCDVQAIAEPHPETAGTQVFSPHLRKMRKSFAPTRESIVEETIDWNQDENKLTDHHQAVQMKKFKSLVRTSMTCRKFTSLVRTSMTYRKFTSLVRRTSMTCRKFTSLVRTSMTCRKFTSLVSTSKTLTLTSGVLLNFCLSFYF